MTGNGIYSVSSTALGVAVQGVGVAQFTSSGLASAGGTSLTVPLGTVVDFAGTSAPTGWQLCYGQAISRTTYAGLFALLSTTYGAGDGSTTFNLPDCRGRTTYGQDNMGGTAASRITAAGGNFDGTVLGNTGGQQNHAVLQTHLPNVNFANSGITLNDPGHVHGPGAGTHFITDGATNIAAFGANSVNNASTTTASATTGITVSNQGSAASGGSGTALPVLSNGIVFNKIIFAGP